MDKKITSYSHFIVYAKGWYERGDNIIDDMKKLVSERCALDIQYVNDSDVWSVLVDALFEHVNPQRNKWVLAGLFSPHCSDPDFLKGWTNECPLERAVKKILSELMTLEIKGANFKLEDPDPFILPVSDEKLKQWEDLHG
tara:strand:- start:4154 stop:4573 length:420 start_codon:yes stop_codon:yes gene_type:complete